MCAAKVVFFKAKLHESKDLAACSSLAVALGKLKLPRLEPAHGFHLLEAPYVKRKRHAAVILAKMALKWDPKISAKF